VDWVVEGGPADRAGLKQGDLVLQAGAAPTNSASELNNAFSYGEARVGQSVELVFLREGTRHTATVNVADPASVFPSIRAPFVAEVQETREWSQNGISFRESKKEMVYRDSSGREAREEFTLQPGGGSRRTVHIFDPNIRVNIFIKDDGKAVVVDSRSPEGYVRRKKPEVLQWSDHPTEYLGTQVIQGLKCKGYHLERTLENASELGVVSSGPVTFSSEIWLSDLTLDPVLEIDQNPVEGRVESRMVQVRQDYEPDAKIFQVPAGYKVEERPFQGSGH
jgi:hypothetical protein